MRFGFRGPSLKKRIAARTSWKRYVCHSLGFKAPREYGWLTDPKKAAYNRVYNRTTRPIGFGFVLVGGMAGLIAVALTIRYAVAG